MSLIVPHDEETVCPDQEFFMESNRKLTQSSYNNEIVSLILMFKKEFRNKDPSNGLNSQ